MSRAHRSLTEQQLERIAAERPVAVLATADGHGRPHCALISWFVVPGRDRLLLALDRRGQSYRNVGQNPRVALQILADDLVLSIAGSAEVARESIAAAPFETAQVLVSIDAVSDQSVEHVEFRAPSYRFSDAKIHRAEVERRVLEELAANRDVPLRAAVMVDEMAPDWDD